MDENEDLEAEKVLSGTLFLKTENKVVSIRVKIRDSQTDDGGESWYFLAQSTGRPKVLKVDK